MSVSEFPALVGRGEEADIQLKDRFVSRVHCLIDYDGSYFMAQDFESQNETFFNGESVKLANLQQGDVIDVGTNRLTVQALSQ